MTTDMAAAPAGARVLPVLTVPEPATAAPLADALGAGGARYVVSPGYDEEVITKCRELRVTVVPGIATATEPATPAHPDSGAYPEIRRLTAEAVDVGTP